MSWQGWIANGLTVVVVIVFCVAIYAWAKKEFFPKEEEKEDGKVQP